MDNKEFYLNSDGIPLHCKLEFPEDAKDVEAVLPLVILVHGLTGHMEEPHLVGIAKALNEHGYAVLRAELYGHGKSGGTLRDHTILHWILEMNDVIRYARGLDWVSDLYLAGHSAGGLTAMFSGAMMEDHLKALILLAPALCIPEDAKAGKLLWTGYDPENIPEEFEFEGHSISSSYLRTASLLPVADAMDAFAGPVLVVHGDADEQVPFECGVQAAEGYASSTFAVIPGDDHCFDYHLDKVNEAVLSFLDCL